MSLWTNGNALVLLENGEDFFQAMLKSIREAKHDIFFESYIFRWDHIGQELGEAFIQAAKRGVKVHILLDHLGSYSFPLEVMKKWNDLGIRIQFYQPLKRFWGMQKTIFPRLHRKCSVIDHRIAFVGGINVADDYLWQSDQPPRLDYAVQIEGPLVSKIYKKIALFCFRQFNDWKSYVSIFTRTFHPRPHSNQNCRAAFVIRSTITHRRRIESEYLKAMMAAKESIIIANAYFLPGFWFRRQLKEARQRGVRVQLLLQGLPDYWIVKWATQAMYQELLQQGIEIYEYKTARLHAKVATIDQQWATVGSCNLDPLSLIFNLEANVIVQNSPFAKKLHERLETHIQKDSKKIALEMHQNQNFIRYFLQHFCLFFIRWLASLLPLAKGRKE
jgi:cardiolipin synthase A/B